MRTKGLAITTQEAFDKSASRGDAAPCLFLLFPAGRRPTASTIARAIDSLPRTSISHHPGAAPDEDRSAGEADWLEIVVDGLTFDIIGLSPGPSLMVPPIRHRFQFEDDGRALEAIGLAPGPHLLAARAALPVVRALVLLAVHLARNENIGAEGALWLPAGTAMGTSYLDRVIGDWAGGGPFPALGLTAIDRGHQGSLRSDGLAYFTGQEVAIFDQPDGAPSAGTRLLVRLIDGLVGLGPLEQPMRLRGPDDRLYEARPNANLVEVRPVADA